MIDNPRDPRIKQLARLSQKAERTETGLFLLEGPQSVGEALTWRPELVEEVFVTPTALERYPDLREKAEASGLEVEFASERVIDALADTVTPQGVVAVCRQFPTSVKDLLAGEPKLIAILEEVLDRGRKLTPQGVVAVCRQFPTSVKDLLAGEPKLIAILEEVRDPGNAGTIIRAADSAGADGVILSGRSVDLYNPKVVRSTTGSLFHLPVAVVPDLASVLTKVRAAGLQVLAADVKGDDLLAARGDLAAPTAWLFGNEARGLTDENLALADRAIVVPIYGRAESMNLATAASVCLYESAFAQVS